MKLFYPGFLLLLFAFPAASQVSYSANEAAHVAPYTTNFLYGSNMGVYDTWSNVAIADIAAGNPARNVKGAGVKTLHLPLPENFLDPSYAGYDYDVEVWQFSHFADLGIKDNTVFLESPIPAHTDNTVYPGCSNPSLIWSNLYLPIWDGGANGTPYNDDNYLARYIYKTVTLYKPYVKFWELVNEPDFDAGSIGWRAPGDPAGNWWDRNPAPCEMYNLRAPLVNYIRMLRIAYEVIKTVDPTAYVGMGGVGYPSFLDAVLRNTDNPVDGSPTADYPLKGGAYFDVLSFHYYPMYDLRYFDVAAGTWKYKRHSDAGIDVFLARKKALDSVLNTRGYNGVTYPKKVVINTENNIARKSLADPYNPTLGNFVGGDEVQRNYDMKALVESQLNGISQFYVFSIGDSKDINDPSTNPFDFVGLYQNLNGKGPGYDNSNPGPYNQQYNSSGISYKTFSDALLGYKADLTQTAAMALPAGIRGGAFRNSTGDYAYVLWAATTTDQSEVANGTYSFPAAMNVSPQLYQRNWDYSQTTTAPSISSQNIALTGSPVILFSPLIVTALPTDTLRHPAPDFFAISLYPNPVVEKLSLSIHLKRRQGVSISISNAMGQLVSQTGTTLYYQGANLIHVPLPARIPNGMYFCRIISGNSDQTLKFMVSR